MDLSYVNKGLAPQWFSTFRGMSFAFYMIMTSIIFFVYYAKLDVLQKRHDKNRIQNLKTALELEDYDFMKMVDDLKIEYDENDLRDIEKEVNSQLTRL